MSSANFVASLFIRYLDPKAQGTALALSSDSKQLLPEVQFMKSLCNASKLSFFSEDDLRKLDTVGYLIKDGFLGGVKFAQAVHDEVYIQWVNVIHPNRLRS
jgi:hypothetical protein